MSTYSVADAKNGLPKLIDRALEGEEVVITRHGKPVAEIRALRARCAHESHEALHERLRTELESMPRLSFTTADLLNAMYDGDA